MKEKITDFISFLHRFSDKRLSSIQHRRKILPIQLISREKKGMFSNSPVQITKPTLPVHRNRRNSILQAIDLAQHAPI
jgi:hypothetical protein